MESTKSLSDLNLNAYQRTQNFRKSDGTGVTFSLNVEFAVGSQSRRWSGSPKTHVLRVSRITDAEWVGPVDSRSYKVGQNLSVYAMCDSNGQHTGTEYKGQDTDSVTCERCLKWLGVEIAAKSKVDQAAVQAAREARQAEKTAKAAAKAAKEASIKRCIDTDWRGEPCQGRASKTSPYCSVCRPYHN